MCFGLCRRELAVESSAARESFFELSELFEPEGAAYRREALAAHIRQSRRAHAYHIAYKLLAVLFALAGELFELVDIAVKPRRLRFCEGHSLIGAGEAFDCFHRLLVRAVRLSNACRGLSRHGNKRPLIGVRRVAEYPVAELAAVLPALYMGARIGSSVLAAD